MEKPPFRGQMPDASKKSSKCVQHCQPAPYGQPAQSGLSSKLGQSSDQSGQNGQYSRFGRPSFAGRAERQAPHTSALASRLFLPTTRAEMAERGWEELDILLVSGDAYIDHPSFGVPLLGRYLEAHGFRVGIIAQPVWEKDGKLSIEDISRMGRPRLFVGVSAGAVDSMLAHYTAFRKKRHDDAYTPGGQCGARPNRAVTVYANLARQAFPSIPLVAGGIEASLRRLSHYDFWTDSLKKSLLPDAKLDLILYGMGEAAILQVAQKLAAVRQTCPDPILPKALVQEALAGIPGSARMVREADIPVDTPASSILPSHDDILARQGLLMDATLAAETHVHTGTAPIYQPVAGRAVCVEPPAAPLSEAQLDFLYSLPFTREPHLSYTQVIPGAALMRTSITSHRGCGGGCAFCSLALHQGRTLASRSKASILEEARKIAALPGFSGSISDIGGPTANMWQGNCTVPKNPQGRPLCTRKSCLFPKPCPQFHVDQKAHIQLLRAAKAISGIKNVRVASGIRFDLAELDPAALTAYTGEFTGGQLKVAPEHCVEHVLNAMRKPNMQSFERFLQAFYAQSSRAGKEQYVVPYLLSGFPGCTDADMRALADWLAARHWKPQQIQCFVPTPGTVATAMFYAGIDETGQAVYVARSDADRLRQHGVLLGGEK